MTLYLKPPRGVITFNDLQKCVEQRLEYFKSMTTTSIPVHCIEYLLEDSAFDRTGHFTFRLAAVKYRNFFSFFVNSEVKLLHQRLHSYDNHRSIQFLKKLLRHSKESKSECKNNKIISDFLNALISVIMKMLSNNCRKHIIFGSHVAGEHCDFFILEVPFHYCSTLLSNYDFELKKGFIQIPCNKWKELFLSLFNTYLRITVKEMIYSSVVQRTLEDERIDSIMSYINMKIFGNQIPAQSFDSLNINSKLFPLCMQNLDGVLKNNHRLGHSERIDLSLFLKDIGLSLNSSIAYWKSEYSKEYSNCANCSHSWQQNEKKYVYSIRHLYGLEGSRKTYVSKSCNYFQNLILTSGQAGGCPYKYFDDEKLKMILLKHFNDNYSNYIDNILVERSIDPSRACKLVAKKTNHCRVNSDVNFNISFNNPVQYFLQMKSMKT